MNYKTVYDIAEQRCCDDLITEISFRRRGRFESADIQRQCNDWFWGGDNEPHVHKPPRHTVAMCAVHDSPEHALALSEAAGKWGR